MTRALLPVLALLSLGALSGCSCNSDGSPQRDAGVPVDGAVLDGALLDGSTSPDSGDPVDAGPCGGCSLGQRCRFDTCVPDLGSCTVNDDCPGDSYCSADDECLPYGVPPSVINDPECQRPDVLMEITPEEQCDWPGDASGPNMNSSRIYTAPIVADLNLDGDPTRLQPSIIVTTWHSDGGFRDGMLRVFGGRDCDEQMRIGSTAEAQQVNRPGYGTQWAVADLDGDVPTGGHPEIIGFHNTGDSNDAALQLYALKIDSSGPAPILEQSWLGRDCAAGNAPVNFASNLANFGPALFDLDDDGDAEILVGTMVFDHLGCLQNAFEDIDYITHGQMNTVADVDLDGIPELVAANRIAEWDTTTTEWVDETYFTTSAAQMMGHVAVVDLGQYSTLPGTPTPNTLPEIVIVSAETNGFNPNTTGTIRVQDLAGTIVWGPVELHHSIGVEGGHGGAPTASDFDGDGHAEFAAAANEFYVVYDPDCATPSPTERPGGACVRTASMASLPDGILWAQPSSDFSSSGTGSSIFDFNGDGAGEAVYRDECYLRVYNGADGDVIFSSPASSGTGFDLPTVADVDGDFATEIVVVRTPNTGCPATDPLFSGGDTFASSSGFVILRDPEDRWAASRPIWNQHAYSVTHVTDDAQVVRTSEWLPNWTQPGLNNFRQNVQGDLGLLNIADLTVVFFAVDGICDITGPTSTELRARVCNRGTNGVQDGVQVDFVERDTTDTVLCTTTTTGLLQPGQCEEVACTGMVTDPDSLFVRVDPNDVIADCHPGNDDGAGAATFCLR